MRAAVVYAAQGAYIALPATGRINRYFTHLTNDTAMQPLDSNFGSDFTPGKAFLNIWLQPRATFTALLQYYPMEYVWPLFYLGGVANYIDSAIAGGSGNQYPGFVIFVQALTVGGIGGIIFFNIFSGILCWTGSFLKGAATEEDCKTIVAWSLIPAISSLALLIPNYIIHSEALFIDGGTANALPFLASLVAELILTVWTIMLLAVGTSVAQKFSTGKGAINILLPGVLVLGIIFGLKFLFDLLLAPDSI